MTTPATRKSPWWTQPRLVLPLALALTTLSVLFAPSRPGPRSGDPRLTTTSAGPLGAKLLYDLAGRLGWETQRRLVPSFDTDHRTIHAVLNPVVPLRVGETHALLNHVRAGGGALVVLGPTTRALQDSLRLRITERGGQMQWIESDSARCRGRELPAALSLWFGSPPQMLSFDWRGAPPEDVVHFIQSARQRSQQQAARVAPTMMGFTLGRGRMVVAADADVFRTDAMRDCLTGLDVAAVRALEFLREGGTVSRSRIVFDEYHQAFGAQPGTISAVALYLRNSPSGHLLTQLTFAGLVLLVAFAPRIVAPRVEQRIERRSPLEHVDALARAYAQVGATRTVAQRLLRGLRRRVTRGALAPAARHDGALDDVSWLGFVATRHPELAEDVALVRRAQADSLLRRELPTLGPALHRIETTLTRPT
ncbi:MAG: hypothetical protein KF689_05775 [Gemmatimonadaceae bacterium]|nr:hypothetical protein [Gemmatimonadaceae bacterium]MCW5825319.1 hypothetical protein [Gemmatimonadaceae bacterium]